MIDSSCRWDLICLDSDPFVLDLESFGKGYFTKGSGG